MAGAPTVPLNPHWEPVDGGDATPTFMRKDRQNTNAMQVSQIDFRARRGEQPSPGDVLETWVSGIGGTDIATMPSRLPERVASLRFAYTGLVYCQAWCIRDGGSLVNVSFFCDEHPTPQELDEVELMVAGIRAAPAKKRWLWFQ